MDTHLRLFNLPEQNQQKTVQKTKEPRIRKAADAWSSIDKQQLCPSQQLDSLLSTTDTTLHKEMTRQITNKIHSYRSQDIKKSLFNKDAFVNTDFVIQLLCEKQLRCFYCKEMTLVLYDEVRAGKQWTLDRIDNSQGHNKDNVEIACLTCNLRRRTMYHERYVFTKQLNIVKLSE